MRTALPVSTARRSQGPRPAVGPGRRRLGAACALLAWCSTAAAGEASADPLKTLTEQYQQDRHRLIAGNLALTAAEARKFWPLYEQYEKDLQLLTSRRQAVIAKFGENYDAMTDAMAREILFDRLRIEEEHHRLRRIYLPRFEQVLPIKKLARYYQIESKIRAAVEAGVADELPLIR